MIPTAIRRPQFPPLIFAAKRPPASGPQGMRPTLCIWQQGTELCFYSVGPAGCTLIEWLMGGTQLWTLEVTRLSLSNQAGKLEQPIYLTFPSLTSYPGSTESRTGSGRVRSVDLIQINVVRPSRRRLASTAFKM